MQFFRLIFFITVLWLPKGLAEFLSYMSGKDDNFCITNSSSAMYYSTVHGALDTQSTSTRFFPIHRYACDFESEKCTKDYTIEPWRVAYSLNHENPPIMDLRWEQLRINDLPFEVRKNTLEFLVLIQLNDLNNFKIPLSLIAEEVHFLLCESSDVKNSNCYWFILQGWHQNYTAIRRCKSGEIKGAYPSGDCYIRLEQKKHPEEFPLYLDSRKWSHVIIERSDSDLYLKTFDGHKEEVLIHYREQNEMFKLNYFMGHRKETRAYCKTHENNYMLSSTPSEVTFNNWFDRIENKNCISIFWNTCSYCWITIYFLSENGNSFLQETLQPTNGIWSEKKIIFRNSTHQFMRIKLKTFLTDKNGATDNEYWSFDDVRECHEKEFRISSKSWNRIGECRLLASNEIVKGGLAIDYVPENECKSSDAVGNGCVSCSALQENYQISCKNMKICELIGGSNVCYCSPGYGGSQCKKVCPEGFYGYSCKHQCGFCQGKCDISTGSCICNPLFEGAHCKIPKEDHYLTHAPDVIKSNAKSCFIRWNSEDFIGKTKPVFYQLQYKDLSVRTNVWMDNGMTEIISNNNEVSIDQLKKNTKYEIRILISDEITKIKKLHFVNLPFAICNTTCNGWNEDNLIIQPTANSVSLKIQLTEDECELSSYLWSLETDEKELLVANQSTTNPIYLELHPFTKYRFVFISSFDKISKDFQTLEGVPSAVREIKMVESTASYMKMTWLAPEHPSGKILFYEVKYYKVERRSCQKKSWFTPNTMNVTSENIELNGLEPFSIYKITISAVNRLKTGEETSVPAITQGLDFFKPEEDLNQLNVRSETSERGVSFTFTNIACEKLQGPLAIAVDCRCASQWCSSTSNISNILPSYRGNLNLRQLQPFCKYNCNISLCREDFCKFYGNRTIATKYSVPNELKEIIVYAVGDSFLDIRWLPPYPPTGKQQIYRITTRCEDCRIYHENTYMVPLQKCNIWPKYYCHRIKDYVYYENEASVLMEAANIENYKYNKIGYERVRIIESPSEKPYNVSVNTYLNNTIEIFWNHPNRTNGVLDHFALNVNKILKFEIKYYPSTWKRTYSYKIREPLPPAEEFDIRIIAVNNKYPGQPADVKATSYPPSPELKKPEIHITNYTKTSISISLEILQIEPSNANVGRSLIILVDDFPSELKDPNLEMLEKKLSVSFETRQRVASEIDLGKQPSEVLNFIIGDGVEIKSGILNKPLQEARYYNISLIFLNEFKDKFRYIIYNASALTEGNPSMTTPPSPTSPEKKTEESSGGGAAYAFLLLLLLIPIVIFIVLKRRNIVLIRPTMSLEKIMDNSSQNYPQSKKVEETILLDSNETTILPQKPVMKVKPKLSVRKSTNPPNPPNDLYTKPVKMAEFEEYVKTAIESGELERQHGLFPRGQTQPWQYGSSKVNKPKNRYNNLVAYDHSRVLLKKIEGDEYSDYINANYIHGYNVQRAYIATQGPKATTLNDFWRMIWQENVKHIVMLANVYEGGKKKVEQYWPNINEELTFQDIVVQYHSMELFANFEYRVFHATKANETREIEQLHFTTWPDHGVPLYPQSLVPFIRKLLKIPLSSASPVVVHCSAGVGRTGTIILADVSLRMAAKQGVVDLLNNLQKLREQRPNMVDNIEQYKLAHLVVLECLMGLQTSVKCDEDMDKTVQKLIKDGDYRIQMNYLKETEWQDQAMKSVADFTEELPNYPEKNRIQEIVPENQGRIFISRYPPEDESSSYINAVQVDAFRCPDRFFVTQLPMPNTVGDFWRLVTERKINVIISLNVVDPMEETCCKFWPTEDEPEFQPIDTILIKFNNVTELEYYDIYSVHVWMKNKRQKEKLDVEIVAFKHWPIRTKLPSSCEEFLSFYEEADAISRRSTNVIVTCFDGATASGVYVALSFMIEQMKLEHECDTCLAVRTIRHNRKQFITDESQFLFLYECAVKFINGFQSYANFQNQ